MTGSVQGSAIDDSFECLTNAPDAWVSGPSPAPHAVDVQHFVEPGDGRSAVDDRCFTEYGAAVQSSDRHDRVSDAVRSAQTDGRSRRAVSKSSSRGKRQPSPSFVIRSKDGESVVRSNPFVLRKSARSASRETSSPSTDSEQATSSSQRSASSTNSSAFKIRIKGKNGEEIIQEIRRPLVFASSSGQTIKSGDTTAVASESDQFEGYRSPNSHSTPPIKHKNGKRRSRQGDSQSGLGNFVLDKSTSPASVSPARSSSLNMSGALPPSYPATVAHSSRSHLLPPSNPFKTRYDPVAENDDSFSASESGYKADSLWTEFQERSCISANLSKHISPISSSPDQEIRDSGRAFTVPDESIEGSELMCVSSRLSGSRQPLSVSEPVRAASRQSMQDTFSRPRSGGLETLQNEGKGDQGSTSRHASSRSHSSRLSSNSSHMSATQVSLPSSKSSSGLFSTSSAKSSRMHEREKQQSWEKPASGTLSLSQTKRSQRGYYSWRAPNDSLYSDSMATANETEHRSLHQSTTSERTAKSGASRVSEETEKTVSRLESRRPVSHISNRTTLDSEKPPSSVASEKQTTVPDWEEAPSWQQAASLPSQETTHRSSNRQSNRQSQKSSSETLPRFSEKSSHKSSHRRSSRSSSRSQSLHELVGAVESWDHEQIESHQSHFEPIEQTADEWVEEPPQYSHESRSSGKRSGLTEKIFEEEPDYQVMSPGEPRVPPPFPVLTTIHEEQEPSSATWTPSSPGNGGNTQYARPGAISPHPLSSIGSARTAMKPPEVEPAWQTRRSYERPFVESASSASSRTSSKALDSRSDPQPRMLQGRSDHSAREYYLQRASSGGLVETAQEARRRRKAERAAAGPWE